ncbi:hypothetical protein SDRG_03917 [Saprolegnia diclina VS20]|uniref:Uncharacterized protein n=1 Tax=Saprolegnia diclina (strain VS20) TaxID=1156394 RepID=T0S8L1_SAPDV|nr:hypothetical protein SDRG_03917 [Saprolegnia diclina VS20]EQC38962.1 hypothetical protein SDRG_03917 [Saprolegnia diclina VS20]|eukprot:XP_008607786.1 hypothetical protein SDRG_03917 [Saprolegnia diclina VS20]
MRGSAAGVSIALAWQRLVRGEGRMGPKAKSKKKEPEPSDNGVTRPMLVANYVKMCRSIGVPVNPSMSDALKGKGDEAEEHLTQLIVDDEFGPLGSGGVRAMACAVLGAVPHSITAAYMHLSTIRIWNNPIGDEGASAIASILCEGNGLVNVVYVELMDCNIGVEGCKMLSDALYSNKKSPLQTLKLNCNNGIGDAGVYELCQGLFTNTTLKQLHLEFCSITKEGAVVLAQLVSMAKSALHSLSLQGNTIGDEGLLNLSLGLKRARSLTKLNLSDNAIRKDPEALTAFKDAIEHCKTLTNIYFSFNLIDVEGAEILLPLMEQDDGRIKAFEVDPSLPPEIFKKLNRSEKGEGKKKKGKKKGKKK